MVNDHCGSVGGSGNCEGRNGLIVGDEVVQWL